MLAYDLLVVNRAFDEWTGRRSISSLGTNSGAPTLAFQAWHHFKEAFPPELVRRALDDPDGEVHTCLDPFGGSGTTALAAQFLGVASTTVEVNPFLVDVIRAKVTRYDADALACDYAQLRQAARESTLTAAEAFEHVPSTFLEPGVNSRWLFDQQVATALAQLVAGIAEVENEAHARLFRVLLGGVLVEVSNVIVSGKGRRYRRNWQRRGLSQDAVNRHFAARFESALADIHRFAHRPDAEAAVIHADARAVKIPQEHDAAVLSPPYPNSFDYTDVYNIELWMLGYLTDSRHNRDLRHSTLTSHVQLHREYPAPPSGSRLLQSTLKRLVDVREDLWSPWIPDMVGGYFADMCSVLTKIRHSLRPGAKTWIVVGDSKYGGVRVPTAKILRELVVATDWQVVSSTPFRSMRSSPQHGGKADLAETLLVLAS
jgi:hypothetical protein